MEGTETVKRKVLIPSNGRCNNTNLNNTNFNKEEEEERHSLSIVPCPQNRYTVIKNEAAIIQELTHIHGDEKVNLAIKESEGAKSPIRYIKKVLNDWDKFTLDETHDYLKRNAKKVTKSAKKTPTEKPKKPSDKYEKFYL
jgi:hypothetical protein